MGEGACKPLIHFQRTKEKKWILFSPYFIMAFMKEKDVRFHTASFSLIGLRPPFLGEEPEKRRREGPQQPRLRGCRASVPLRQQQATWSHSLHACFN